MDFTLLEKAAEFVRIDGQLDRPIVFLTMEGEMGAKSEWTAENLDKYLNKCASQWIPSDNEDLGPGCGSPGLVIPKIVTTIRDGNVARWREYRAKSLYRDNECNVKYFPIARQNSTYWNQLGEILGVSQDLYYHYCDLRRPEVLAKTLDRFDPKAQLFVILSEPTRWLNVLQTVFMRKGCRLDLLHLRNNNHGQGHVFYAADGIGLAGGYFPGIASRVHDFALESFARCIAERRGDIRSKLK